MYMSRVRPIVQLAHLSDGWWHVATKPFNATTGGRATSNLANAGRRDVD